ncbi:hypothetical protein SAMN04244571_04765, partial [Azotobacter beijerinckii]
MAQKIEVVIDGKNNAGKAIEEAGTDLQRLGDTAASVAGAIGGVLSVGAFAGWIKGSIDTAAEIEKLARLANTSTTQFQQWAVAARTVGIDYEGLSTILEDTTEKIGDFLQSGGGEMADFFDGIAPQIGVTAEQFKDLSGADALLLFVDSLEKAGLSQAEMTFYLKGVSDELTTLLPLLQNGGAGIKAWTEEAERMGLILSHETIAQAANFNKQLGVLGTAVDNIGLQIAAGMLPTLEEMSGFLLEMAKDTDVASTAAEVFGTSLKILATLAIGTGSTLARVGRDIGALAAAATAAASGEFAQASEILRMATADNLKSAAAAEEAIRKLWSGEYRQAGERAAEASEKISSGQKKIAEAAEAAATLAAKQQAGVKGLNDELDKERDNLNELGKEQEVINKLKELNIDLSSKEAKQVIEKAKLADSEKKASEAKKKAEQEAESATKKRAQDQAQQYKQQESYVAGLEKQAATLGLTAAQVRA